VGQGDPSHGDDGEEEEEEEEEEKEEEPATNRQVQVQRAGLGIVHRFRYVKYRYSYII